MKHQPLTVYFQNEDIVVFFKPARMHVHPHEDPMHRVPRSQVILYRLRDQLGMKVYPVHRLDAATEGVMLMALHSEAAGRYQKLLMAGQFEKTYEMICRGWLDPVEGVWTAPLERDSNGSLADSETRYKTLHQFEVQFAVSDRHSTTRYSLVEAKPITGRWHQIRRHAARSAHPIVGDREHGDSRHNRYFREKLGVGGLLLRSKQLAVEGQVWVADPSDRWALCLKTLQSS